VCRKLTELTIDAKQPIRAIRYLRTAIQILAPSPEHLTPLHSDLMQVSLLAKTYSAALPYLDQEPLEIDHKATSLTTKDVLLYFYYGGMVYTGLKQFEKARGMFKLVRFNLFC
jgi:COP9 signalosome complex subunit 3